MRVSQKAGWAYYEEEGCSKRVWWLWVEIYRNGKYNGCLSMPVPVKLTDRQIRRFKKRLKAYEAIPRDLDREKALHAGFLDFETFK